MLGQNRQTGRGKKVDKIAIHYLNLIVLILAVNIVGDNQFT